jgi:hypothetical protein
MMETDHTGTAVIYGDSVACYHDRKVLKIAGEPGDLPAGMILCHQAAFVRAAIAREKGFDLRYRIGADFEMLFRIYAAGGNFLHTGIPVVLRDISGLSNRHMVRSAVEHCRVVNQYDRMTPFLCLRHCSFIAWVAMVSIGYRVFPEKLMHGISNRAGLFIGKERSWNGN